MSSKQSQTAKQSTEKTLRTHPTDHVEVPSVVAKRVRLYANRKEVSYRRAYLELLSRVVDEDGRLRVAE